MSNKEVKEVQDHNNGAVGEKKPTVEESIETMRIQLKEYSEKAEYFKSMTFKAQGALEVLLQLDHKEEEPTTK